MLIKLQSKYNLIKSAIIIGFVWEIWHIPVRIMVIDSSSLRIFIESYICLVISTISLSVVIAYICSKTKNSIVSSCIIHSIFTCSLVIILPSKNGLFSNGFLAIITTLVLLCVIIKLIKGKTPKNFKG